MSDKISLESLRAALNKKVPPKQSHPQDRLNAVAHRYESAVRRLLEGIQKTVEKLPELDVTLDEGTEEFTSPAFPGLSLTIADPRLKISMGEDFLLFDPTAKALLGALGQIAIQASKPIPFLIEKVLFLCPDREDRSKARWVYRSTVDFGQTMLPFTEETLLHLLHAVFA